MKFAPGFLGLIHSDLHSLALRGDDNSMKSDKEGCDLGCSSDIGVI